MRKNYTLTSLTPLIMGGAFAAQTVVNQECLRVATLRGVLRFWFRAAIAGYIHADVLRQSEADLFGAADEASPLRLRIVPSAESLRFEEAHMRMGDAAGRAKREAIAASSTLTLAVHTRYAVTEEISRFEATLGLLTAIGGEGARTRRGFGSLSGAESPLCYAIPEGDIPLHTLVEEHLCSLLTTLLPVPSPPLDLVNPAVSVLRRNRARIWVVQPQCDLGWATWREAMDVLRTVFYRPLKTHIGVQRIGSADPRLMSPLHLQIKCFHQSNGQRYFFGIIVLFKHNLIPAHLANLLWSAPGIPAVNNLDSFVPTCPLQIREIKPWPIGT